FPIRLSTLNTAEMSIVLPPYIFPPSPHPLLTGSSVTRKVPHESSVTRDAVDVRRDDVVGTRLPRVRPAGDVLANQRRGGKKIFQSGDFGAGPAESEPADHPH